MKKYYSYLKYNNEKTCDQVYAPNRIEAVKYFALKKLIKVKDWLKIYTVYEIQNYNELNNKHINIYSKTAKILLSSYKIVDNNIFVEFVSDMAYYNPPYKNYYRFLLWFYGWIKTEKDIIIEIKNL